MNQLLTGDCLQILPAFPDNHFDSCIVDPPYFWSFMNKAWDTFKSAKKFSKWCRKWARQVLRVLKPGGYLLAFGGPRTYHLLGMGIEQAGFELRDCVSWVFASGFPKSKNMGDGWGTALKPAHELVCIARKPLSEKTVTANVQRWGTGALNIDACRVGLAGGTKRGEQGARLRDEKAGFRANSIITPLDAGRWPANLMHDGSEEVAALFPQSKGQQGSVRGDEPSQMTGSNCYGGGYKRQPAAARKDEGSAARFFFTAKASTAERGEGNDHACVKPQALLRYLARLVTPPGGRILDHFTGSGSGPLAFTDEGFSWTAIDLDPHNIDIAESRLQAQQQAAGLYPVPFERAAASPAIERAAAENVGASLL